MKVSSWERRVVIVDDSRTIQAMLDNAFSKRPDFRVVGFCSDAQTAAEMIQRLKPDIVTIDLCMPYLDGAALLGMISDLKHVCKIIVSDQPVNNILLASKLIEAGASTCIGKSELVNDVDAFFAKVNAAANLVRKTSRNRADVLEVGERTRIKREDATTKYDVSYPVPTDEADRLNLLRRKKLANSVRERQFDLVTKHVAKVTAFPVCLLTFIDRDTQWIKSAVGLDVESTPRHQAFCNYTISQGGSFVVANATADVRFSQNALVTASPNIRSYAGHPVTTSDGVTVGALCVIDNRVRTMSRHLLDELAGMSEIVAEMIDQRPAVAA